MEGFPIGCDLISKRLRTLHLCLGSFRSLFLALLFVFLLFKLILKFLLEPCHFLLVLELILLPLPFNTLLLLFKLSIAPKLIEGNHAADERDNNDAGTTDE